MKIFITGRPGSGKTTTLLKCVDILSRKYKVGGIITPEVRNGKERVGFEVVDIYSERRAIFASVEINSKFKVGKYGVDLEKFDEIFIKAMNYAMNNCEIIAIDEIGKMELLSTNFSSILEKLIKSEKILIATLHISLVDKFKGCGKVYFVEFGKSEELANKICKEVEEYLETKKFS